MVNPACSSQVPLRNSNRYCSDYFLQAGFVFAGPPGHYVPDFGHKGAGQGWPRHKKAAVLPGCGFARLLEFLGSSSECTFV
tara:strand:+ start:1134 stop:1376 length:243 start_codon:yes stop_codon:yes gene_type:complete